jgi:hypothetical protein
MSTAASPSNSQRYGLERVARVSGQARATVYIGLPGMDIDFCAICSELALPVGIGDAGSKFDEIRCMVDGFAGR